jgi:hypothetical protein
LQRPGWWPRVISGSMPPFARGFLYRWVYHTFCS